MEERRRIVNENVNARVIVAAVIPRIKALRQIHHGLLNFNAVKVLEQGICKQVVSTHAATEADHRSVVGLRLHGHRHEGCGRLRKFIA